MAKKCLNEKMIKISVHLLQNTFYRGILMELDEFFMMAGQYI